MSENQAFVEYIQGVPKSIKKHRHRKYDSFPSEFDNPYYLITWKEGHKTAITIRMDAATYWALSKGDRVGEYSLTGLTFITYSWYGWRTKKNNIPIDSLTSDVYNMIHKRGRDLLCKGGMGLKELNTLL